MIINNNKGNKLQYKMYNTNELYFEFLFVYIIKKTQKQSKSKFIKLNVPLRVVPVLPGTKTTQSASIYFPLTSFLTSP